MQIIAAVGWAIVAIAALAKFFKDWKEVVQGVQRALKGVGVVWKWVMRSAIWRKDIEAQVTQIKSTVDVIKGEVTYNGGGSTKDAVKRVELQVGSLAVAIEQLLVRHDTVLARLQISALATGRVEFTMDKNGAWVAVNEVFVRQFGWDRQNVKGYAYENIIHEDDINEMRDKIKRAIAQCSRFMDEVRIKDSRGEYHKCCMQGIAICKGDELVEFAGFIEYLNK